jgi:peroxiredoxin Q/BCP
MRVRGLILGALAATAMSIGVGSGGAVVIDKELAVGDPAPSFSLPGSDGKTHTLAEYAGRAVVLAWFPKAFTSG